MIGAMESSGGSKDEPGPRVATSEEPSGIPALAHGCFPSTAHSYYTLTASQVRVSRELGSLGFLSLRPCGVRPSAGHPVGTR